MTDDAQEVFLDALEVDDDAREAWLAQRCAGRPALAAEVAALLAADRVAEGFLDPPAIDVGEDERGRWLEGRTIGSYTIVRRIGVGGMGTVYEAMQQRPRRKVALKLLRAGLVSPELRRRFEQEAEILGRLRHRAIAEIYEAGTYDSELGPIPYFALEFVDDARTLSAWVAERSLDPAAIVGLVIEICEAIGHAHAARVVHRDIKPSNVLVGRDGRPRLIDFGVARATDDESRRVTLATAVGELVGTLYYMSPEQCSFDGAEIDGRTDVYSLGVVLYELLAGRLPYPVDGVAPAMVPELVRTHVAAPPLRGGPRRWPDLDAVVLTAIEKSARHRYATAEAFADDLRRVLQGEPVQARRSQRWVGLRRLWWRGRKALPLAAVAAGVGLGAWAIGRVPPLSSVEPDRDRARDGPRDDDRDDERERYRHRIAVAERARDLGDLASAKVALREAPEAMRGWEWRRLQAQLDGSLAVATLGAGVDAVAYADDHRVVAVTEAGEVTLLEQRGDTLAPAWTVPTDDRYLTLAVDGAHDRIYVGGDSGRVHTMSLVDGASTGELGDGGRSIWGLAIVESPHGIVVSREDGSLQRWDLPASRLRWRETLGRRLGRLAVHGDRFVAAIDDDGAVIGALSNGAIVRRLEVPERPEALAIDDRGVITGAWWSTLARFDAAGHPFPDGASLPAVLDLEWTGDDDALVAGADGLIRRWRRETADVGTIWRGHDAAVRALAVAPGGGRFVSGSTDATVRLWDPAPRPLDAELRVGEKVHALAWSRDGAMLFTGSGVEWDRSTENTLVAWSIDTGAELWRARDHAAMIEAVAAAPGRVISGDRSGAIVVRAVDDPTPLRTIAAHDERITGLAVSPTATTFASSGADGTVATWDVDTGTSIARVDPGIGLLHDVLWHGDELVVVGARGLARWTGAEAPQVTELVSASAVVLGATGEVFVGDVQGRLQRLGAAPWTVQTQGRRVLGLALDISGTRLAVASEDGRVRLFDTHDGALVSTIGSHTYATTAVAFSPDGSTLATSGFDLVAKLWRAPG